MIRIVNCVVGMVFASLGSAWCVSQYFDGGSKWYLPLAIVMFMSGLVVAIGEENE